MTESQIIYLNELYLTGLYFRAQLASVTFNVTERKWTLFHIGFVLKISVLQRWTRLSQILHQRKHCWKGFPSFNFSFFCCESRVLLCFLLPILAPWVKYRREVIQSLSLYESFTAFTSQRTNETDTFTCLRVCCAVSCACVCVCTVCHLVNTLRFILSQWSPTLSLFVLFESWEHTDRIEMNRKRKKKN